jgi:hypothetical protein
MVNPSNLYAEKIFSEHPIAMWTLEDKVKYVSLITDAQRSLASNWTFTSSATGTAYDQTTYPYYKLGTTVTQVSKASVTTSGSFTATSNFTINIPASDFQVIPDTFTIGFYYFKTTPYISSVRIGYKVGGTTTWSSSISTPEFYEWGFASATFPVGLTSVSIVLEFTYAAPTSSDSVSILINGLTVGNLAEDANLINLGSQIEALPSTLGISATFTEGIPVSRYNSNSDFGYIITAQKVPYGRNTSFPMTYGSETILLLSPNEYDSPEPAPSLVVPGHGFLNESEKYKTKTFEAWIRVKAQTLEPRRIIGPITGTDGLYVNGAYLTLSVGKTFGSFYIGEWDRPMLIHIVTSINSSKLFLNGELVISLTYDTDELSLADYYETSPATYDWIGFYCYVDVPRLEVDSIAIYPYEVDKILALRRFVYAQGIDFPTAMITSNGGEALIPDYSVSNYTNNYTYGDSQKLPFSNADILNNVDILGQRIKPPAYKLPQIRIEPGSTETSQTMLDAQVGSDYLDLQPTAGWNDIESHIYFDKLSQTQDKTKAFYVLATRSEANASKQIVFKILNKLNGNYLEAYTITSGGNNNIIYSFSYNGTTSTLATISGNVVGTNFDAGINIDELISANTTLGSNIQDFFSNQDSLAVCVGGDELFTENTTFTGKIYYVGFANARNLTKIADLSTNGLFRDNESIMGPHIATYTLIVKKFSGNVLLDIATNMYWQESVPLASLGKFIGGQNLLDYLQVNVDYPKPIFFSSGTYSTSNIALRLYLTFQDSTAIPLDILNFGTVVTVKDTNVIENTTGYATTAYEMVDGTAIYVPDVSIDSYVAIIHAEINVNGIITNPFSLRNIQIASQTLSLDPDSPTEIGTKLGPALIGYENLIVNQSFEKNTTGWGIRNGTVASSAADKYIGFKSALFTVGSSGTTAGINVSANTTYMTPVTPGDIITYSIYVKDINTLKSYRSFIDFYDATPTFISGSSVTGVITSVTTTGWTKVSVTATVPATAAYARPYTYSSTTFSAGDAGKQVYFDLASVREGDVSGIGANNPIILPKENDNHLYLSSNSGMLIAGTPSASRGHYMNINSGRSADFDIGIIQATMKFAISEFSTSDVLLFDVEKEDGTAVKFYIDAINSYKTRARVFAKDEAGTAYSNVEYFINGTKTEYPVVPLDEWVTLGIRFTEQFSITSQTAKIRISGPMMLNNLFYSQLKAGDEASKILTTDIWANVLYSGNTKEIWDDYDSGLWSAVYTVSASATEINGLEMQDVYESFVGTQKVIAFYDATSTKLKTKSYQYVAYIGSQSDTITSTPL